MTCLEGWGSYGWGEKRVMDELLHQRRTWGGKIIVGRGDILNQNSN